LYVKQNTESTPVSLFWISLANAHIHKKRARPLNKWPKSESINTGLVYLFV